MPYNEVILTKLQPIMKGIGLGKIDSFKALDVMMWDERFEREIKLDVLNSRT